MFLVTKVIKNMTEYFPEHLSVKEFFPNKQRVPSEEFFRDKIQSILFDIIWKKVFAILSNRCVRKLSLAEVKTTLNGLRNDSFLMKFKI